jgi:endonuclease YncB( thermonuclease family)
METHRFAPPHGRRTNRPCGRLLRDRDARTRIEIASRCGLDVALSRLPSLLLACVVVAFAATLSPDGRHAVDAVLRGIGFPHGLASLRATLDERPARDPRDDRGRADGPSDGTIAGSAQVIDGDTLDVDGTRVRLFGIDAPESKQSCQAASGDDYRCGSASTQALRDLVGGHEVACRVVDRDRYQRWVSRCAVDGADIGDVMVRKGFAVDYARYSHGAYAEAEREAHAGKRGLWAGTFEMPDQWRRRHPH